MSNLDILAQSVVHLFVAGSQPPITVEALGRTFDTDRKVRVSKHEENGDEDRDVTWEGSVDEWRTALRAQLWRA
jgi:hypothetical protein